MKNRVLRAVSSVMLSAMLVIAVAIPVGAACGPYGHTIVGGTLTKVYTNASNLSHEVTEIYKGKCGVCNANVETKSVYVEPHTFDKNGKCTECGYEAWHSR